MTTINNAAANNQTTQSFDSLKKMRSSTIKDAGSLLAEVRDVKRRIQNINQAIDKKQKAFAEQSKAAEAAKQQEEKPAAPVMPAAEVKAEPQAEKKAEVRQPQAAEQAEPEKPKSSVNIEITYVEPLIAQPQKDQKIFIDEKGNRIVRKFITDRFPQRAAQPQQQQRSGGQNRNQGQRKPFDA